jgi:hypothetical protein
MLASSRLIPHDYIAGTALLLSPMEMQQIEERTKCEEVI